MTSHLLWQPKIARKSLLTADWTFLCPSPSVPARTVPVLYMPLFTFIGFMSFILLWKVAQLRLPETIFVFLHCPHMRSSLVEKSISTPPSWKCVCPPPDCFGYQWCNGDPFFCLVEQLVSRLTAGDLADLPSVCPGEGSVSGELLDMFWLEMTLTRDTKRWDRS